MFWGNIGFNFNDSYNILASLFINGSMNYNTYSSMVRSNNFGGGMWNNSMTSNSDFEEKNEILPFSRRQIKTFHYHTHFPCKIRNCTMYSQYHPRY